MLSCLENVAVHSTRLMIGMNYKIHLPVKKLGSPEGWVLPWVLLQTVRVVFQ